MSKDKIAAIYPLSPMQKALLFHRLQEQQDQGFLQVQCRLSGALDIPTFERAWQQTLLRHAALRSSIHWEKIEKPVQVVQKKVPLPLQQYDWRTLGPKEQEAQRKHFLEQDRAQGFDLAKASVNRLHLIRLAEREYQLIWSCHHILLDGWSASIVLQDVCSVYRQLLISGSSQLPAIPSYGNYLNWLKQQPTEAAKTYWQEQLAGVRPTFLAWSTTTTTDATATYQLSLSPAQTDQLRTYAREARVTLNTILQAVWAIVLGHHTQQETVLFGTTVSGRSAAIPNLNLLAGLFMNVLPNRFDLNGETNFSTWIRNEQQRQLGGLEYEYIPLNQITDWLQLPGRGLFDSLFVVENFPWEDISSDALTVSDFSGGITSTYPLTVVVIPGAQLRFEVRYQSPQLGHALIERLFADYQQLLALGADLAQYTPKQLADKLEEPLPAEPLLKASTTSGARAAYSAPQNATELALVRIWEQLFDRHPIGTEEHFFDMGGSSLQAVQLFARIEAQFQRNLPPTTLFQHPTIQQLAKVLLGAEDSTAWSALVPIRAAGQKPPLFCIHAGGGHIFFYNELANQLDAQRPVYAMQPVGLDGSETAFQSTIEEMARHYIREIRSVQPEGPYHLLGTCFSNAVCFEMAKQLIAMGQSVGSLIIVDSAVIDLGLAPQDIRRAQEVKQSKSRLGRLLDRYRTNPLGAIQHTLRVRRRRFQLALERKLVPFKNVQERNLWKVQQHLVKLYLNYEWTPYSGSIVLIRSQEFSDRPNLAYHITQWSELAMGGLEVHIVPGRHDDLFDAPYVNALAQQIETCITSKYATATS